MKTTTTTTTTTHYCPLFHPLLSEISSSSCKDLARGSAGFKTPGVVTICGWSAAGRRPTPGLQQQLQGSCVRVRRIQNARRRNHLRMVRGGAQTHTRSAAARILCPGPQGAWLRAGEGIGWLAAGAMPNSLYRMPLVYLSLTCVFCYSCSFLFVVCVFVFFFPLIGAW